MSIKSKLKPYIFKTLGVLKHDVSPKILYYHDLIGKEKTRMATPFELFQAHINVCKNKGWSFVKSLPQNKKEVMIFFDDGYRGIWDHHEWLIQQNIYPTTSIAIKKIGNPGYLTWEEVDILHKLGFPFISHTWNHKSLTECTTREELLHELKDSRLLLSDKIEEDVTSICFPRGLFSNKVIDVALESGYKIGYSSIPGNSEKLTMFGTELTIYPRNIVQFSHPIEFDGILNGGLNFFQSYYLKRHFVKG